jgi:hypothetical protein
MNADGANVRRVTNLPGYDDGVDWSPDGSYIAFETSGVGLNIIHPDGSGFVNLVNEFVDGVSWSPDGSRIASPAAATATELHTVKADGTGRVQLTHDDDLRERPRLVTGRHEDRLLQWCGGAILMNTDGTGVTKIPNTGLTDASVSWQAIPRAGDLNCDGEVNVVDALMVLRHVAGLPFTVPDCLEPGSQQGNGLRGDLNCDGEVNAVDALILLRYVVGLPFNLPLDCPEIGP